MGITKSVMKINPGVPMNDVNYVVLCLRLQRSWSPCDFGVANARYLGIKTRPRELAIRYGGMRFETQSMKKSDKTCWCRLGYGFTAPTTAQAFTVKVGTVRP